MKKLVKFVIILFPWLLGGIIFRYDEVYYMSLNIPSYSLSSGLISIIWVILYILISISIYKISKVYNIFRESDYFYVLITNYLSNSLFLYGFFSLKSPFLGFVLSTITFVSSIFLFIESKKLNIKASYYLIPYIIYSLYAFILSLNVYVINF